MRVISAVTLIFLPATFAAVRKFRFLLLKVELTDFRPCSAPLFSTSLLEIPTALCPTGFGCIGLWLLV